MNSRTQLFAFLQRASRNAYALDVTPHHFIRIKVCRVTRQEVLGEAGRFLWQCPPRAMGAGTIVGVSPIAGRRVRHGA